LQEAARGTLVAVKIASEAAARPVAAIYKKHRALSPAMEEFLAMLKRPL